MITGGVIPIVIRRMIHITNKLLMFCCPIDMAVKCPHRPVSNGAGNEPYHENAFEHNESLHHINSSRKSAITVFPLPVSTRTICTIQQV